MSVLKRCLSCPSAKCPSLPAAPPCYDVSRMRLDARCCRMAKSSTRCSRPTEQATGRPSTTSIACRSTEVNVAYNWTIFGTYGAFNRCFNRENVENGLAGRILMSELPDTRFSSIPKYKPMTQQQKETVWQAAQLLQSKNGFVDTPRLRKAINQWLEEKRLLAMKNVDEAMDELRKRSAVIAFRCAVVFHLLSGKEKETKACVDFMLMMADYVLRNQMHLLSQMIESQQQKNEPMIGRVSNRNTFDRLPDTFTMDDLKIAKGTNYEESSYRSIVSRWKKEAFVEEVPMSELGNDKRPRWRKLSA